MNIFQYNNFNEKLSVSEGCVTCVGGVIIIAHDDCPRVRMPFATTELSQ